MNSALVFFIIELILLFFIAVLMYYLYLLNRRIRIYNRLGKFSLIKINKEEHLFDDFFNFYDLLIKKISKFLKRIKIFDKYSLKYNKYILKEEKDYLDKMDFVSKKLLISFIFLITVLLFDFLKQQTPSILQLLFVFLIGFYVLDLFLISTNKLLNLEEENDLLKAITIMNNSFKSGRSIMQAIKIVSDELDSPLGLEFKKMYVDLTYGLSLDVVFKRFEARVKLDDIKYITTSLNILNETGGDIVKVFESVEKTFFNNKKLKDELKNLTAASKFLYYVLLFIPIILVLVIFILDNTYFNILFKSSLGYLILITSIVIYITYIIIVKKVMKLGGSYE